MQCINDGTNIHSGNKRGTQQKIAQNSFLLLQLSLFSVLYVGMNAVLCCIHVCEFVHQLVHNFVKNGYFVSLNLILF